MRRAARATAGEALRLRLSAGRVSEDQRRAGLVLLDEARGAGGAVLALAGGDLLLTEAAPAAAGRCATALEALFRPLLPEPVLRLPLPLGIGAEPQASLARAEPGPLPPAGGVEAALARLDPATVLRRETVLRLAPGQPPLVAMRLLAIAEEQVAARLGPAGQDPDLLRHACDRVAGGLLAALGDMPRRVALLGSGPWVPLLLALPLAALPEAPEDGAAEGGAAEPGEPVVIASLAAAEAIEGALPQARRAALRAQGWQIAVGPLTAPALAWLAPERFAADRILLRWSPALAERGAAAALRRVDPARLVLLGCDGLEALEWGLGLGVACFGGAHVEAVLAASRMAACPAAGGCTRRQCLERGLAANPEGHAGCANPALLQLALAPGTA